jgi:hypothetical protein
LQLINLSTEQLLTVTDTPQHIYDLQLKAWLLKTPEERLIQFLKDNDDTRNALNAAKEKLGLPDTVTDFLPADFNS